VLSQDKNTLNVILTYGQVKVEFTGTPEAVLSSITNFLSKQIPTFDLAHSMSVSYSLTDLVKMFGNYVKITPEGPRVWIEEHKLSDKDIVALQLVAARIGKETGRATSSSLTLAELQSLTRLNPKSISSRISEMSKQGYVEKETTDQGVRYKITTQGIYWLNGVLTKKVKS